MKTATRQINWSLSKDELVVVTKIAKRAVEEARKMGMEYQMIDATMDVAACHLNGCALDLDKLLHADDTNFCHDIFGIRRHLSRVTGQIKNHFLPRCTKQGGS